MTPTITDAEDSACVKRTPFEKLTTFNAATLANLYTAFDDACSWLTGTDGQGPDEETRKNLALRIVECAGSGERDPEQLKTFALADLNAVSIQDEPPEGLN